MILCPLSFYLANNKKRKLFKYELGWINELDDNTESTTNWLKPETFALSTNV